MATPSRSFYQQPLIAVAIIVAILYLAKAIIVPLALAILLTFVLTPVVNAIQRQGLGRLPAVILTALFTFGTIGLVGCIVGLQVHHLAGELPTHRQEIDAKITALRGDGDGTFSKLLQMFREIGKGETTDTVTAAQVAPKDRTVVVQTAETSSLEQLGSVVEPILEPLAQAGLIVVLVLFMLINREDLRNRVIGLLGHGRLLGTTRVLVDSAQRLSRFLLTQLLINVGFGVLFALGLLLSGVPYAFLWGFFAVILRFVPYIGSMVALGFPLVLSFAVAPGWTQPILVVANFSILELITANVVEPLLVGHGTGVSPIALLVAAAFWTWVWGPVGLVLSTPLTVCLTVLGQHVPSFQFLALLLGDKPALEPYVAYYQRLLARDQQEAQDVALEVAKQRGLENVYDEVFLPALELARRDAKLGELGVEDETYIMQATKEVLNHVAELAPGETASPGVNVLVLGCPAHREAEELSLAMLAQLLKSEGYQFETATTKMLPTEVEARVEEQRPALVFIAVLPPGGLVQARYLCKRLRKRFAKLPIVVGYWGDERRYDQVLGNLRSAGASYVTTSLLQSRSQIRALVPSPAAMAQADGRIRP